mmetsp:Transcript_3992/g.6830  ORF Transcript_3992/g.6830 Transcript_3992/m.6830 type:complete len:110 (-) Transcript_3992:46-375(-)
MIGRLSNLGTLNLNSNELTGSIPSGIESATDLRVLLLAHNRFVGSVPMELANLTKLEVIDLSSNELLGTVPDLLCEELQFLQEFKVDCSDVSIKYGCNCCNCVSGGILR